MTHLNEKESKGKCFTCEWCDFKTLWENSLRKHKRTHTIEKSDLGDFTTSKDVDLRDFQQTNQGGEKNDDILKCDMCPYLTKYPRQMKIHKTNHAKDKLFKCDMCSYSASRSYYLKMHKRTHTGETFKCDATSFSTRRSDYLKRNKLKHRRRIISLRCVWIQSTFVLVPLVHTKENIQGRNLMRVICVTTAEQRMVN